MLLDTEQMLLSLVTFRGLHVPDLGITGSRSCSALNRRALKVTLGSLITGRQQQVTFFDARGQPEVECSCYPLHGPYR